MQQDEAARQVFIGSAADLIPTWIEIDEYLTSQGLTRDVKTIYVSYTDPDFNLVAAVHPDPASHTFEVALAIATADSTDLYDATHLKWRKLPVAVRMGPGYYVELSDVKHHLDRALQESSQIQPRHPEEFFATKRRGRRIVDE